MYRQLFSALKYPRPCPILRARINSTEEIGLPDNSCLLFNRERGFDRGKINSETSLDELYRKRVPFFLYFSSHLRKLSQNSRETDEWTRLFAIPRDRDTRRGGRYWEYFDNVRVRGAEQMPRCATRFLNTKRAYSRSPDLLRRAGLQDKEAIIRGMGMFRPILRKFRRIRSDRLVVEVSPPIPFFFSLSVPRLTHEWKGNAT